MQNGIEHKKENIQRNIRNSFWSMLDASLYPVANLAAVPILFHSLGPTTFGLWILLQTFIVILQLFNFNLATTAIRNVASELAQNKTAEATDTINGILHITFLIIVAVIGAASVLALFAPANNWFGFAELPYVNTSMCILFAAIIACLKYFDQIFLNIIKAKELFKLASILNIINRFSLMGINISLALNKFSISYLLLANISFLAFYIIIQFVIVKKIIPFYKSGVLQDRTYYRKLVHISYWMWLQALVIGITFQTDRMWVSASSGLNEVSRYGLVSTIFNHIHMIFMATVVWVFPRITAMASRGEDPSYLYNLVRGALIGFITISLLFFYLIVPIVFPLWIGTDTYNNMASYIKAFVAFEIVFAHTIMPFFYLNATGKERTATRIAIMYCTLCYSFMLGGLWLFHSPVQMIQGMTLSLCITMPIVNRAVQKKLNPDSAWECNIYEMTPMYAAILLIYSQNTWISILLAVVVISLLWRFYLSNVFKSLLWKQVANT